MLLRKSLVRSVALTLLFVLFLFLALANGCQQIPGEPSESLSSPTGLPLTNQAIAVSEILQSLETGNWFVRTRAANSLGEPGTDIRQVMPGLRELSGGGRFFAGYEQSGPGHNDGFIRKVASEALTEISPEPYMKILKNSNRSLFERIEAAELLGQIKSEQAIQPLVSVIQDEALLNSGWTEEGDEEGRPLASSSDLFLTAAWALAEISPESSGVAVPGLVDCLQDESYCSSMDAIELLGKLEATGSVRALSKILRTDNRGFNSLYIRTVIELGYSHPQRLIEAIDAIEPASVVPTLASLLILEPPEEEEQGSRSIELRISAANTLAELGPQVIPNLLQIVPISDAILGLSEVLSSDTLKLSLRDNGEKVDRFTEEFLSQAAATEDGLEFIRFVAATIQDQELDSWLRRDGLSILALLKTQAPVQTLTESLKDTLIRCDVAITLSHLPLNNQQKQEVLSALSEIMQNPQVCEDTDELFTLYDAARAQGRLGAKAAVPTLSTIVVPDPASEIDPKTREEAAYLLGELRDSQAVPALTEALLYTYLYSYDPPQEMFERYWDRNEQAAAALGKIGTEKAITSLIKGLSHEDWVIRRSSAEALATLDSKAVPALLEIITASSSQAAEIQDLETQVQKADLRRSALYVLGLIGQPAQAASAALEEIVQDEDDVFEVQLMAQTAFEQINGDNRANYSDSVHNDLVSLEQDCPDISLNTLIYAGRCVYPNFPVKKVGGGGSWAGWFNSFRRRR